MKNSISFIQAFQAELFKNRRNSGLIALVLFPLFASLLILTVFACKSKELERGFNYWSTIGELIGMFYWFYPVIIAIAVFSASHIEEKNGGYKHLFTLPVHRTKIYIAKWSLLILYTLLSVMVACGTFLLGGHLLDMFCRLGMNEYPVLHTANLYFLRILLYSLAALALQHLFTLLFRHLALSLGIALFINVTAIILSALRWEYLWTNPYAGFQTALTQFRMEDTLFWQKDTGVALVCFLLFSLIGHFIFVKKRG